MNVIIDMKERLEMLRKWRYTLIDLVVQMEGKFEGIEDSPGEYPSFGVLLQEDRAFALSMRTQVPIPAIDYAAFVDGGRSGLSCS